MCWLLLCKFFPILIDTYFCFNWILLRFVLSSALFSCLPLLQTLYCFFVLATVEFTVVSLGGHVENFIIIITRFFVLFLNAVAWKRENSTHSLNSALDEFEWASSRSSHFSPWYELDGMQVSPTDRLHMLAKRHLSCCRWPISEPSTCLNSGNKIPSLVFRTFWKTKMWSWTICL